VRFSPPYLLFVLPSHLSCFDHHIFKWKQIMKKCIQVSQVPCPFLPVGSKYDP
jgi:hypothetical protein